MSITTVTPTLSPFSPLRGLSDQTPLLWRAAEEYLDFGIQGGFKVHQLEIGESIIFDEDLSPSQQPIWQTALKVASYILTGGILPLLALLVRGLYRRHSPLHLPLSSIKAAYQSDESKKNAHDAIVSNQSKIIFGVGAAVTAGLAYGLGSVYCPHVAIAAFGTALLAGLNSLHNSSAALQDYKSAHAIVVSHHDNHKYVLLGKICWNQKLSTFGGLRDPGEIDPKVTCAREVDEESLGVFGSQQAVGRMLQNAKQICGFSNGHICYLLPATDYGKNISHKFRDLRFKPAKPLSYCQQEMIDIVAIRVDALKDKIAKGGPITFSDNEGVERSLCNPTEGALRAAIKSLSL